MADITKVTFNGTTYDIKDASSRAGVTELKSSLNNTLDLDGTPIPYTIGGTDAYIRARDGVTISSGSFDYTDYVDLGNYKYIHYGRIGSTATGTIYPGIAFYDSSKTYISGVVALANQPSNAYISAEAAVPKNAKYARFTLYKSGITQDSFSLSGDSVIVNAVANSDYFFTLEQTITSGSVFAYFSGANSKLNIEAQVNDARVRIVHPSGATSSATQGVGAIIATQSITGAVTNILVDNNLFQQDHTSPHKMELEMNLHLLPFKVVGSIDYFCDGEFKGRYDVNIALETEASQFYAVGGYFNTGSAERTIICSGELRAGGNAVVA